MLTQSSLVALGAERTRVTQQTGNYKWSLMYYSETPSTESQNKKFTPCHCLGINPATFGPPTHHSAMFHLLIPQVSLYCGVLCLFCTALMYLIFIHYWQDGKKWALIPKLSAPAPRVRLNTSNISWLTDATKLHSIINPWQGLVDMIPAS
jgi:hypothetical protein